MFAEGAHMILKLILLPNIGVDSFRLGSGRKAQSIFGYHMSHYGFSLDAWAPFWGSSRGHPLCSYRVPEVRNSHICKFQ